MTKKTTKTNSKIPQNRKIRGGGSHSSSREKQRTGIAIAILLMAIGFAAVTTTLTINGTIKYGYDKDKFIVKFTKATLDDTATAGDSVDNPTIGENGQSITYTTKELKTIGEKSVLKFTVTNESTQYDASVKIECTEDEQNVPKTKLVDSYVTLTEKFGEDDAETPVTITANGGTAKGKITVTLIKATTEARDTTFKCTLTATPVEITSRAN